MIYLSRQVACVLGISQGEVAKALRISFCAAAASLGHDPAIFLRTYAHLYPGDLRAVADAMDAARINGQRGVIKPTNLESRRNTTEHANGTRRNTQTEHANGTRKKSRGFRGDEARR